VMAHPPCVSNIPSPARSSIPLARKAWLRRSLAELGCGPQPRPSVTIGLTAWG
jgi:hypothetical protein